jgi:hypothetical protein
MEVKIIRLEGFPVFREPRLSKQTPQKSLVLGKI